MECCNGLRNDNAICKWGSTAGSKQRGAIDGTAFRMLLGDFSSAESRNIRTRVERLPVLAVEIAQLKRLHLSYTTANRYRRQKTFLRLKRPYLLHWNTCQGNCDTVGVRTGDVVRLDAADLTKQMTSGFGVEAVLREVILAAFEQRELLCGNHKVPILLHEANGAVAVPHDQMARGQKVEADGIAVATTRVRLQLLLHALTLPLWLPMPLL